MSTIHFLKIILLFIIWEVSSCSRTIDVEEVCQSTGEQSDIQEKYDNSFTCSGVEYTSQILDAIPSGIKQLVITNSNISEVANGLINGSNLDSLLSLKISNSITGSLFWTWIRSARNLQYLELVNSSTSVIIDHDDKVVNCIDLELSWCKKLQKLKISGGYISSLKGIMINENPELSPVLDLSDNYFECGKDFTWLIKYYEESDKVVLNGTICFMEQLEHKKVHYPILYTMVDKPFINVMQYKRESIENCPEKCQCKLNGMISKDRPQLNVECIGINMTKLPDVIPRGSTRCNFSSNFIEDLTPLYVNKLYDNVGMIDLSHNYVSFLDPVRFPAFLLDRRDVGFWLHHNRVTKFPAKSVQKVYESALKPIRFPPQFFLGHNPWMCTCDYIEDFQSMIYQHMYDIYDARDVRCSDEDPYNPGIMVLALDVAAICTKEHWINYIDILNIILAFTLLLLIIDFTYNYQQYKKNRKLPWIVTKFKC